MQSANGDRPAVYPVQQSGPIEHGDTVSIFVEGIGTLTNPVIRKGKS